MAAQGGGAAKDFSPYSFRVTMVTDLLGQNVPLDDSQLYCLLLQFCPGFLLAVLPMNCRPVCHSSRDPVHVNGRRWFDDNCLERSLRHRGAARRCETM